MEKERGGKEKNWKGKKRGNWKEEREGEGNGLSLPTLTLSNFENYQNPKSKTQNTKTHNITLPPSLSLFLLSNVSISALLLHFIHSFSLSLSLFLFNINPPQIHLHFHFPLPLNTHFPTFHYCKLLPFPPLLQLLQTSFIPQPFSGFHVFFFSLLCTLSFLSWCFCFSFELFAFLSLFMDLQFFNENAFFFSLWGLPFFLATELCHFY